MFYTLLSLLSVVSGVALKIAFDAYIDKKKSIELEIWKIRVAELENRLTRFYWPIYLRLQRDNVIWHKILERENPSNEDRRKLAFEIERGILIPNHEEIVKIIESNIHLADADTDFKVLIFAYLRHIDVYSSIRAVGIIDKDPIHFDEPYPKEFFNALEGRLLTYQDEYKKILRLNKIG